MPCLRLPRVLASMILPSLTFGFLSHPCTAAATEHAVAGTSPDRRPEGAPTISEVTKDGVWYDRALTGLEPPYPSSFRFLEDQGHWNTPFTVPGMKGPYDIRGWHSRSTKPSP